MIGWTLMLLAGPAHGSDEVQAREVEVVALKSGAYVQLDPTTARRPGRLTVVQPADEDRVFALECILDEASDWRGWSRFFGGVAAEALPASFSAAAFDQSGGCVATAGYGTTEKTRNVVTLSVQARLPGGASGVAVSTSISRRESEGLSQRLAALADEAAALEVPDAEPEACVGDDAARVALEALYAVKGWRTEGDPGFEADLDAVRRASEGGRAIATVIALGIEDRRLKPGTLGDAIGLAP